MCCTDADFVSDCHGSSGAPDSVADALFTVLFTDGQRASVRCSVRCSPPIGCRI